jgi:hypothetical protein
MSHAKAEEQEQLMQMAVDGAGFSPAEADQFRRPMGSKRSALKMERRRERFFADGDRGLSAGMDGTRTGERMDTKDGGWMSSSTSPPTFRTRSRRSPASSTRPTRPSTARHSSSPSRFEPWLRGPG